jgi:hypothetical protein
MGKALQVNAVCQNNPHKSPTVQKKKNAYQKHADRKTLQKTTSSNHHNDTND